ncbi:unnamed protein product [Moneuplotes crassus]|uniref:AMP-dependent synthetase/ligase domain-containing protein n=1 Tax=Euplotes crassus TaxID=5936 RepID=A0AAD1U3H7_EUPCR|nr:unnamed protein product [Moneuplotes crassus]
MYPKFIYGSFREEEKCEDSTEVLYNKLSIEDDFKLQEIPKGGGETLLEGWNKAAEMFPDNNCLGHIEGDKYVWRTYKEALHEAQCIAKVLFTEDLIPEVSDKDKSYKFVGLYSRNRPEWALVNWALVHFSGTVVSLYNTLGEESLCYAVDHTDLGIVACDKASFKKMLNLRKEGNAKTIKHLIAFDEVDEEEIKQAEEYGIQIHLLDDIVKRGEAIDDKVLEEMTKPTPDTTDVICFTSGTTGRPKGGMISHKNYTANIRGGEDSQFLLNETDVIMSYLPLAHCYEKWLMALCLWRGVAIGYFNGNPLTLVKDIQMLKPTILPAVPRVLTKIYDTINLLMSQKEYIHKLYKVALKQKLLKIKNECKFTHLLWDSVIFKNHRAIIGGRVRFMLTGSAPISPEILDALKCSFCSQIVEGYGQTETNAPCLIVNPDDNESGHIGGPLTCAKIKLEDIPDMEYFRTDKPYPRGEICVKGPVVFQGYYKADDKNQEAFDDKGWLHTGDVAEIRPNGSVKLIDRKKNLFKLSQGEYISPEKLENVYNKSQFVAQIFVHGLSTMSYLVAVIVPDPDFLKVWASKKGLDFDLNAILESQDLKDEIQQDLDDRAKNANLNSLERIKKLHLTPEMFSVENGLLTPSMKLVRHHAKTTFKDKIQDMYNE